MDEVLFKTEHKKIPITTHRNSVVFTTRYTPKQVEEILAQHASEALVGQLVYGAVVPGSMHEPVTLVKDITVSAHSLHIQDDYDEKEYSGHEVTFTVPAELVQNLEETNVPPNPPKALRPSEKGEWRPAKTAPRDGMWFWGKFVKDFGAEVHLAKFNKKNSEFPFITSEGPSLREWREVSLAGWWPVV